MFAKCSRVWVLLSKRSTATNLLVGVGVVSKCLYEGTAVELINPGFTNAFDYVNHRLLLAKGLDFFILLLSQKATRSREINI